MPTSRRDSKSGPPVLPCLGGRSAQRPLLGLRQGVLSSTPRGQADLPPLCHDEGSRGGPEAMQAPRWGGVPVETAFRGSRGRRPEWGGQRAMRRVQAISIRRPVREGK